ncbi:hypothetical protein GCM10010383_17960 [Streptomyces lomondensis]|uniref:Uncharacterized protein n=1 Tax=Streptomyces lomondensis TaxID=68229 RepID=A0ABQ2X0D5_9ACTN|nr:hypothetical protein GCM10010383_17960 [Streptomyces lomondensis]
MSRLNRELYGSGTAAVLLVRHESYWYLARGGSLPGGMTTAAVLAVIALACLAAAYLIKRQR